MTIIRQAAVAGKFYPENPRQLEEEVWQLMDTADVVACQPKILIAPHAGYEYSGRVAASAYATLDSTRSEISRVVILGTCHTSPERKIFASSADSFETPLGSIQTDRDSVQLAIQNGIASVNDEAHLFDHAIEVQLPFLQLALEDFKIAPFLVCTVPTEKVSRLLHLMWGGRETLILVSSDLSHNLSYDEARAVDQQTADAIVHLEDKILDQTRACGCCAIAGAIQVAREKSLECIQLDLRNSGDTTGFLDRVVGYGAFAFCSVD